MKTRRRAYERENCKSDNSKTAVRGGEAGAAKQTAAQGDLAQRNAAPAFAQQTKRRKGRTRPFRLRRSGTRPKGAGAALPAPDADAACAQSAQELLQAAARAAVQMLVRTVDDENATLPQRMDAAKTILDRVCGKASQPIEGNSGAAVQVVMSKEVRELMG